MKAGNIKWSRNETANVNLRMYHDELNTKSLGSWFSSRCCQKAKLGWLQASKCLHTKTEQFLMRETTILFSKLEVNFSQKENIQYSVSQLF